MATTIVGYTASEKAGTRTVPVANGRRRRLMSAQTGHALEILGHAIEYLTDEYVHEAEELSAHDPRVEAIQILMQINRELYFGCPFVPTLRERFRALVRPWLP